MLKLNLIATGKEQSLIKEYLEQNVSETLAEKINQGVKVEKDNKALLNKKDLNGFMKFANEEARKLAEKETNCACIEDKVVYGWAIHYFEEDSIEGTLYNEDGSEFMEIHKPVFTSNTTIKVPVKEQKKQASLFDFIEEPSTDKFNENDEEIEEELEEENLSYKGQIAKHAQPDLLEESETEDDWSEDETSEVIDLESTNNQALSNERVVDMETGEIMEPIINKKSSIDKEFAIILFNLLDGKLEVK